MLMDTSTATGAAVATGISNASRGTAINASPNPILERISVPTNTIAMTRSVVRSKVNGVAGLPGSSVYRPAL